MTTEPLKFRIGNNVIHSYKRLAYTPWHAIAEFIDNSTQSFFNNQEVLVEASRGIKQRRPLCIDIKYEASEDFFCITDNAMGMSFKELVHALHVSEPPENTTGRSQFGMGMKTAASWLGNRWTIVTKKLGSVEEYTVEIDVNKVANGDDNLKYQVNTNGILPESHYTKITIYDHNRRFHGRTLGKIAQYLRSMYRQDFRAEILTLKWRGDELNWEEIDHRLATDKNGNPYQRHFDFYVGTDSEDPNDKKDKRVKGWIGVLAKGKRRDAGLTVFHANRVVMGWPETYRPEEIYGDERNNLLNQRLLGEIHLDDFLVSHTKDAIQWMGDQEEQVEKELKNQFVDYMRYANEPRKGNEDSRGPTHHETQVAVSELETELRSNELADVVAIDPMLTDDLIKESVSSVIRQVSENSSPRFFVTIGSITVYLYLQTDMSINDRYLTVEAAQSDQIIIIINENHPHWYQISGADGVLNYLRHCVYDGIAEWQARKKVGSIEPDTIKVLKDRCLRIPMEIERR